VLTLSYRTNEEGTALRSY